MIRFNCPNCGRHYELPDALASLPLVCKQCGQRMTPPAPSPEPPPPPKPVAPPPPAAAPKPTAAPAPPKPVAPKPAPPPSKPVEPPKPAPAPVAAPKPAPVAPATPQAGPAGVPPTEPDEDDVLVAKPDASPDIDFNIGGPTAASLSEATRARPAGLTDLTRRAPDLSNAVGPGGDSLPELNLDLLPPAPPPPPPRPVPAPPPEPPPEKPEPTTLPFLADLGAFVLLVAGGLFLGEFLVRKPMGTVLSEAGAAPKFPPVDLLLLLGPPVMFGLIYLLLGNRERTLGAWIRRRKAGESAKSE